VNLTVGYSTAISLRLIQLTAGLSTSVSVSMGDGSPLWNFTTMVGQTFNFTYNYTTAGTFTIAVTANIANASFRVVNNNITVYVAPAPVYPCK
jgi:hypothetical protein